MGLVSLVILCLSAVLAIRADDSYGQAAPELAEPVPAIVHHKTEHKKDHHPASMPAVNHEARPLPAIHHPVPAAQPAGAHNAGCSDSDELCCFWASKGQCESNAFWMKPHCQKACGSCGCTVANALTCVAQGSECTRHASHSQPGHHAAPVSFHPHVPVEHHVPVVVKQQKPAVIQQQQPAPVHYQQPAPAEHHEEAPAPAAAKAEEHHEAAPAPAPAVPEKHNEVPTSAPAAPAKHNEAPMPHAAEKPSGYDTPQAVRQPHMPSYRPDMRHGAASAHVESSIDHASHMSHKEHSSSGSGGCVDSHESCSVWAKNGECEKNAFWMLPACQKSCHSCGKTVGQINAPHPKAGCTNNEELCQYWSTMGECKKNAAWMKANCALSCGTC